MMGRQQNSGQQIVSHFKGFLQQFLKVQDADGNDEGKDSITM